jgi:hypothetical protein
MCRRTVWTLGARIIAVSQKKIECSRPVVSALLASGDQLRAKVGLLILRVRQVHHKVFHSSGRKRSDLNSTSADLSDKSPPSNPTSCQLQLQLTLDFVDEKGSVAAPAEFASKSLAVVAIDSLYLHTACFDVR